MPARASRRRDLHDHLVRSRWMHPERTIAERQHPGREACPVCRWPVDPAAGRIHPNCDPEETR